MPKQNFHHLCLASVSSPSECSCSVVFKILPKYLDAFKIQNCTIYLWVDIFISQSHISKVWTKNADGQTSRPKIYLGPRKIILEKCLGFWWTHCWSRSDSVFAHLIQRNQLSECPCQVGNFQSGPFRPLLSHWSNLISI